MSLRKKSITGVFWTFLQQFSGQAITFVVSIFLARILMPEDFGLIGMIGVFLAVSQVLANSGLTQSIIRQSKPTQSDYSTVFFFNIVVSVILYIILFLCAGFIADFYKQPVLTNIIRVIGLTFIINAFGAVQFTRLTKQMDFKTQMMVTVPSLVISGAVGIYLAYNGYGVWTLVYMSIVQAILQTVQVCIHSRWMPSWEFSKRRFKYHFGFSYKLGLSGLINTIFNDIYQIVIGKYFAPAQVGFYTRAVTMKNLPVSNISSAINRVTYPMFAEIKNDNIRLKSAYKIIMQSIVFAACPIMIYLAVVAEPLFRLIFTEKWLPAVPYFQILCSTAFLYPLHSYNLNIIMVKGRSDLFLKLEIIKKIVIVIMILFAISYGIIALLIGQVISSIIALFINSYYSGKFISYPLIEQLKDIAPIVFLSFLIGGITYYLDINYFINLSDILRMLISGMIGFALFIGISHCFKIQAYLYLLSLIKNRT